MGTINMGLAHIMMKNDKIKKGVGELQKALETLEAYQEIGTIAEFQQYKDLGSVEELKARLGKTE